MATYIIRNPKQKSTEREREGERETPFVDSHVPSE